jgi:N-acetylmuramoyl-L-alanine amidase
MNIVFNLKSKITLLLVVFSFLGFSQSGSKFKVALDAGHGAKDPGTQHNGHIEKKINLAIVLKVGEILERNPNIDVIYTRKTDVFIDLVERADIANRANANIFVSIHCDAIARTEASGYQTFVMGLNKNASNLAVSKRENAVITLEKDYKQKYEGYDPNNPGSMIGMTLLQEEYMENSISLASKIQEKFSKDSSRKNRGVTQAPFMVLHKASMPRVLIETGFISNPTEGDLLESESGQQEIAEAIADAITSYKREYFGEGTGDYVPEKIIKTVIEKDETPTETSNFVDNSGIIFKIQIAASNKKIDPKPRNFKGLNDISFVNESGNFYKYMYGNTSSYETAKKNLEEAKKKGYKSAYVLAFKDGKKIDVKDAIK